MSVAGVLRPSGDDEMVLEAPGAPRERGLRLEVGADPAAAFAIEQRDIGDPQRRRGTRR
jgi:hypothetical protein